MKDKLRINQIFVLLVLTVWGSATLFFLGKGAKQDAWLVHVFGVSITLVITLIFIYLYREFPEDTIITYLPKIFGKVIGYPIAIIYIARFIYLGGRVLRDFCELILTTTLTGESLYSIGILLVIPCIYCAYLGIEVFAHLSELLILVYVFVFISIYVMIYFTGGRFELSNILPILDNGLKPVFKETFPYMVIFPYGMVVLVSMLFRYVERPNKIKKYMVSALLVSALGLVINTILIESILNIDFGSASIFPLVEITRIIKVGFVDRMDLLSVIIMFAGGFAKITLCIFVSLIGIKELFKLKIEQKKLALPIGVAVFLICIFSADSYPKHIEIGLEKTVWYFIHLYFTIPILAAVIHVIKRHVKKRRV